ncbi:IS3 family transposase [Bacillus paramycoides]|uniref:IS3 family transposase n=1 Tax=Bacillus paramycoides TaxID=2026194 RepID=UPI003807BAB8
MWLCQTDKTDGKHNDKKDYEWIQGVFNREVKNMEEYNYTRYQCTLKKMASVEYRNHLVSA